MAHRAITTVTVLALIFMITSLSAYKGKPIITQKGDDSLYETIKAYCKQRGITVSELERRAGLGNGAISKWQRCSPNLDNLERVANVLGIKVTTLISKSKERQEE